MIAAGGMTASELTRVLEELPAELTGLQIADTVKLADRDDLVLFFRHEDTRRALILAPGGPRARLCTTIRRYPRRDFATGPMYDQIAEYLRGANFVGSEQRPGERACSLSFEREGVTLRLQVELFGNRGIWVLTDSSDKILALSRIPRIRGRELGPGKIYRAPSPAAEGMSETSSRFVDPVLQSVDRYFTELDRDEERHADRRELELAIQRAQKRLQHKTAGLCRQLEAMQGATEMRARADLILAYGHSCPKGAEELEVPDPYRDGELLRIELDPAKPVHVQAENLYKKARKYEDGAAETTGRRDAAQNELDVLTILLVDHLAATEPSEIEAIRKRAVALKLIRPRPKEVKKRIDPHKKITRGENYRRAESIEGYPMFSGRSPTQNDKLVRQVARGNDLWFHVAEGYAGSHVVVRLPKNKSASLETLLDAGTLAVHFSKARGAEQCDVIYTQAKHVRKPKGLAAGKVLPSQTKTLRVRLDPQRLSRLLASADAD